MEFKQIFSDHLDHCYAIMRLKAENRDFIVVASEENQACYAYDLDHNYQKNTIWPDVGGTMTMVQIPGTLNFLATQRFYPGFNSAKCRIVKETFNGTDWDQTVIGDFPYVHRFDIIEREEAGSYWYLGCSIANSKKNSDDWSDPGKIWVGVYEDSTNTITDIKELPIRITKNHGYRRIGNYSLITGVEGIFKLDYPLEGKDWQITKLSDIETSDLAVADINQDGKNEYLAIEGFHGSHLRIYDEDFKTMAQSKTETPFGHAIWGGRIGTRDYFIFGWRDGSKDLELITDAQFTNQTIAKQVGPSNVTIFEKNQKQYLLSANREANEVAIYVIQ